MSLACKFILLVSVLCYFFFSVPPAITNISGNQSVTEADNVTLNCEAAVGNPEPRITWTKVSNNRVVTFPLVISRRDQGYFRCTADNGVGNPATKDVFVTVHCEYSRILLTRHNCTFNWRSYIIILICFFWAKMMNWDFATIQNTLSRTLSICIFWLWKWIKWPADNYTHLM